MGEVSHTIRIKSDKDHLFYKDRQNLDDILKRIADTNSRMHSLHAELNAFTARRYGYEIRDLKAEEILQFLIGSKGGLSAAKFHEIMMAEIDRDLPPSLQKIEGNQ